MNQPIDIAEQLAAFLAGELDDDAAAAVQARIDGEPWVAQLADQTADLMMSLAQVDDVPPREGYEERLRLAVAAELDRPVAELAPDGRALASATAAATGWAQTTSARATGRGRWSSNRATRVLAFAAGIAVLAVGSVSVLVNSGFGSGADGNAEDPTAETQADADSSMTFDQAEMAAEPADDEALNQAMDQDAAAEEPMDEQAAVDEPAADIMEQDAAQAGAAAPLASSSGPQLLTLGRVEVADEELRVLIADAPAAQDLLGVGVAQVPETAATYRDEILRSEPYADGTPATTCLLEVLGEAGGDLVPAVAARIDLADNDPSIAFALVRSADGGQLDRVDVYVVDATTCQLKQVLGDS